MRIQLLLAVAAIALVLQGCAGRNYGDSLFHLKHAASGKDVMWIPTKTEMAHEMLALAGVGPQDIVIDLGSGDGVIPIEAAKKFGVRARGIEYNPDLVALSQRNAQRANVSHLVSFRQGDIFVENFSEATVLTLYLGEALNNRLRPTLLQMRPGTRIVSNTFRIDAWAPDRELRLTSGENAYLWIVPGRLEGEWDLNGVPGASDARMRIRQGAQFFDGALDLGARRLTAIEDGRLNGSRFQFRFKDSQHRLQTVTGTVDGSTLTATLADDPRATIVGQRRPRP
ncbi:MAG: methyltransferase domain-containing protein [Betaproteobacteria bacterium]|nr:methyltransferase domain-containing protein [Betaproteobacteria bacterium]